MRLYPFFLRGLRYAGILLVACVIFSGIVLVTRGVHLHHFAYGSVHGRDLSLGWNRGLVLQAGELRIDGGSSGKNSWNGNAVRYGLKMIRLVRPLFASAAIDELWVNGYRLHVEGRAGDGKEPLLLRMDSEDLRFLVKVFLEGGHYRIKLEELRSSRFGIRGRGDLLFIPETLQLTGQLTATVADILPVRLHLQVDPEQVVFKGKGTGPVSTIAPIVDLFGLDSGITPWISEYLSGNSYFLTGLSGRFPWSDPASLLDNLHAGVRVEDCAYTFASGFDPVRSRVTDFTFSGGVLDIIPRETMFYGQPGGESRLKIDFNDPDNILLTINLRTRARMTDDIIRLLGYYGIELPFVQTGGEVKTDLTLAVNLNNTEVRANGGFTVQDAFFRVGSIPLQVDNGKITLAEKHVILAGLQIRYTNMVSVSVGGTLSPTEEKADIDIAVERCAVPLFGKKLNLADAASPLQLRYTRRKGRGELTSAPSHWRFGGRSILLDGFRTPFDTANPVVTLSSLRMRIPSEAEMLLSGKIDPGSQLFDLRIIVEQLRGRVLSLDQQEPLEVLARYHEGLDLEVAKSSDWLVADKKFSLAPLGVSWKKDTITLERTSVHSSFLTTGIQGAYDLLQGQGRFLLNHLSVAGSRKPPLIRIPDALTLNLRSAGGSLEIDLDRLGLSLRRPEKGRLDVTIVDFGKLKQYSPLLKRLDVQGGHLRLYAQGPDKPLRFKGELRSSYGFLVENERPQTVYVFSGQLNDHGGELLINRNVQVSWDEKIRIQAHDIGFNLPDFLRFRKNRPQEATDRSASPLPELVLSGANCFIVTYKAGRLLADTLRLRVQGDERELHIKTGKGRLDIIGKGEEFSLKGEGFDGPFMAALLGTGDFEGGSVNLLAEGTLDSFHAVLKTGPVLLKNHAMLNNILAVINTLPALMTFSLPGYRENGWLVDSALLALTCVHGKATITALELESAQMDVKGSGTVDLKKMQVDLKVNLITEAGQNVARLPMVGYILAGEEKRPTLTFHLTGDLLDPKVTNTAFEKVMTMPFGMIVRTLKTPFKWADSLSGNRHGDEEEPTGKRP